MEKNWDEVWSKPLVTSDYSLKYIRFMSDIEKRLSPGSKVLEAGCGTGQTLALFKGRHMTYGLDKSSAALEIARDNCDTTVLGDILNMGMFHDGTFDLVYNSGVIEHFPNPKNIAVINEMVRVTKKNGVIVIIVPNTYCPWYRIWKWYKGNNFEFGYEEDYTAERLVSEANKCKLNIHGTFGLQILPPMATNSWEIFPESTRKWIGYIEDYIPFKVQLAYAIGIFATKL
jgi:SAM-dependent methyltransferase